MVIGYQFRLVKVGCWVNCWIIDNRIEKIRHGWSDTKTFWWFCCQCWAFLYLFQCFNNHLWTWNQHKDWNASSWYGSIKSSNMEVRIPTIAIIIISAIAIISSHYLINNCKRRQTKEGCIGDDPNIAFIQAILQLNLKNKYQPLPHSQDEMQQKKFDPSTKINPLMPVAWANSSFLTPLFINGSIIQ